MTNPEFTISRRKAGWRAEDRAGYHDESYEADGRTRGKDR
jgi:hypothetical protein